MADVRDLKSRGDFPRVGSTPTPGTIKYPYKHWIFADVSVQGRRPALTDCAQFLCSIFDRVRRDSGLMAVVKVLVGMTLGTLVLFSWDFTWDIFVTRVEHRVP